MLISVIIPVYNCLPYLPECLRSIEKQGFQDMEIVLVDDGSDDGSEKACDDYKSTHDNVTVIHRENGGASAARNTGIKAARGEYIHFIDSDDILDSDGAYHYFQKNIYPHRPDIVFSRCVTYSDDMSEIIQTQTPYLKDGPFSGDILYDVLSNRYRWTMTSPVNKMFRRSFLTDNELYFTNGLNHEEDEWLPRVIAKAETAYFYNDILYGVRYLRKGCLSEISSEENRADKACSKVIIAATGMVFMEQQELAPDTLSLAAEYYWDYLIDACTSCCMLTSKELKNRIYREIADHRSFFDSCRYLKSKNRRVLGLMFKTLGIRLTVKTIGKRYGK